MDKNWKTTDLMKAAMAIRLGWGLGEFLVALATETALRLLRKKISDKNDDSEKGDAPDVEDYFK